MSKYFEVLSGVRDSLISLGLASFGPSSIVIRKRLSFFKGDDPLPLICISPAQNERYAGGQFADGMWIDYPVFVCTFCESALSPEDLAFQLNTYESIRTQLFYVGAPGLSYIHNVVYDPEPVFDLSQFATGNDVSLQLFTYRTTQTRRIS